MNDIKVAFIGFINTSNKMFWTNNKLAGCT